MHEHLPQQDGWKFCPVCAERYPDPVYDAISEVYSRDMKRGYLFSTIVAAGFLIFAMAIILYNKIEYPLYGLVVVVASLGIQVVGWIITFIKASRRYDASRIELVQDKKV